MKYSKIVMSADLGEMLQEAGLTHFKLFLWNFRGKNDKRLH
jgi:hypothetical protein